ncbi:bifunctional serine/threonine-protein kinase/universal stress protein [Mesorhizobium sp. YC-39]|uniref:bifunctional serine/threonine-protein kinase/universal stress protein n=1 Tax=unclassified Mesorhizobium TaxID=325217 RepID=UPI0021E8CDF5|nr:MULTISPECIES: bifunctional serine/threonine-protein kinase/universal stress protein [unclassified Mesorhizobium]MCV3205498.1 bifunctional serine/threonine-protein kinase/universal stress protein [Mesorhizobium sp. YC-2]MCV3228103.1 bifunctional serine/threonine-protein kinase/universal stress protein [Mesorhizobium sp. YC-39]
MQRFEAGAVIDGFKLVEKLPSGGMASLWRATNPRYDFPLVLKIPFLDPGGDVSVILGFEAEELILKRLSGPHVPRFAESGSLAQVPYIAMEFVTGTGLADLVGNAPLPVDEVARIGTEIATALASLHRQKVVHLDLKPENIILAERGAVLLDFGLARHAELPDLLGAESSMPMGTAVYISPEQVLGERSDPASDVFALGCILYQLATSEEPFGRPTTFAGMRRRLYHAPRSPRDIDHAIPQWLEAIILRCMEVDRSQRYVEAAHVLSDLRNPDQVVLVRRKPQGEGVWAAITKLFFKTDERSLVGKPTLSRTQAGPSIVLAAVDLAKGSDALAGEVLNETARVLASREDSWLACVTVLKTEIIGETPAADETGRSEYLNRLVGLKDWARPLCLPEDRISYHVLEAVSPGDAILNYAEHNDVGHIVVGARASSAIRRHLGSVSTKVVAQALCSVSVVRLKAVEEQRRRPL